MILALVKISWNMGAIRSLISKEEHRRMFKNSLNICSSCLGEEGRRGGGEEGEED